MGGVKTAGELAVEYWEKPPIERIHNTVQDYVYDYQQRRIDELKSGIQDIWTNLDERQSKEYIIEECEKIIQELLK